MAVLSPARVFCLIPARAGSSRVPDKNIQVVGDASLLDRAVATALEAFGRVFVSTDSAAYAAAATKAGATVPALRPPELAGAHSPVDGAVHHALREWGHEEDIFVLVQATSPFTVAADLRGVVAALQANPTANSALTASRVPAGFGALLVVDEQGLGEFANERTAVARTQDVSALALPSGGAYAAPAERLRQGGPLLLPPLAVAWVDPARALDIDDLDDLAAAQRLATR